MVCHKLFPSKRFPNSILSLNASVRIPFLEGNPVPPACQQMKRMLENLWKSWNICWTSKLLISSLCFSARWLASLYRSTSSQKSVPPRRSCFEPLLQVAVCKMYVPLSQTDINRDFQELSWVWHFVTWCLSPLVSLRSAEEQATGDCGSADPSKSLQSFRNPRLRFSLPLIQGNGDGYCCCRECHLGLSSLAHRTLNAEIGSILQHNLNNA